MYNNGWLEGACGTGYPYYLLCQSCRESHIHMNQFNLPGSADLKNQGRPAMEGHGTCLPWLFSHIIDPCLSSTGSKQVSNVLPDVGPKSDGLCIY